MHARMAQNIPRGAAPRGRPANVMFGRPWLGAPLAATRDEM